MTATHCHVLAAICLFFLGSSPAQAEPGQTRAAKSGDMVLEDTNPREVSATERGRAAVESWLASMDKSIQGGAARPADELTDAGVGYLVSLYFFCVVRAGGCPFVLDSVLESDVIFSKNEGKASCPTMSRFWKVWLAGDFDQRAKYSITPGIVEKLDSFNDSERPRYVKCKDTVALILADRPGLAARYTAEGSARQSLGRTRKLLEEIWERRVDISAGHR